MRRVTVIPFNPRWINMFEKESILLRQILKEQLIDIHHIGSTSVAGMKAKPIIDIMPVVKDIEAVDQHNEAIRAIGYEARGENGIVGRRYYEKGGNLRTHHLHFYENGSSEVTRHLAFREYLKMHAKEAECYNTLKHKLALQFPEDIESYIAGKSSFVAELERRALKWYQKED